VNPYVRKSESMVMFWFNVCCSVLRDSKISHPFITAFGNHTVAIHTV